MASGGPTRRWRGSSGFLRHRRHITIESGSLNEVRMSRSLILPRVYAGVACLVAMLSCGEPVEPRVDLAKASGSAVTVTSVEPGASARNVTLDVQIFGTGYDRGSTAAFALGGVTDPR